MAWMNRRTLIKQTALLSAAAALPTIAPAQSAEPFTFVFLTDTHLQPELDAAKGCDMAFRKIHSIRADFAIQGGDHIFDALAVPKQRALALYDLYDRTEQQIGMKLHHTIGNHDVVGVTPSSGVSPTDPQYGKKLFADRFGKTYYSFDHKGHHFIVLDSIGITSDRMYEGRIDAEQLAWLAAEMKSLPAGKPVIVVTHIPLVTAYEQYNPPADPPLKHHSLSVLNSAETISLFDGHNVLGVLQGHTHVNETVLWKGVPFITSGAVSGNWWHGTHLGSPEGYSIVTIANGKLTTRYETYGFKSVEPQNT